MICNKIFSVFNVCIPIIFIYRFLCLNKNQENYRVSIDNQE